MPRVSELLRGKQLPHLDEVNPDVNLHKNTLSFLDDPENMPVVSANAYLGYRAIKAGLDEGADIIICGRVADASPVIAAAAWWHQWKETQYDELAAALVGGHLIECSTYVTGGNFAGAYKYPVEAFLDIGLPIAEISKDGACVVTKHEKLGGFVTADTVKCQLLYELQGNIYLNSDVKADLAGVVIDQESKDRVAVSGIKGYPPPPTTKLAVFYRAGYQAEVLINASGYATPHKWDIQEAQVRDQLRRWNSVDEMDVLDFQRVGVPMENPDSQLASTTYMRIFAQAKEEMSVRKAIGAWNVMFMAHFPGQSRAAIVTTILTSPGMHCSLDLRTALPKPFLAYYPALVSQQEIDESVTLMSPGNDKRISVGPPKKTEPLSKRDNYETNSPVSLNSFGSTTSRPLGDIALARSGDKGANVNLGLFVQTAEQWEWFRSFMTRDKLKQLMGKDWKDEYFIERVEFPKIYAVHFVVYGPLGRGVSSSRLLDCLGKGYAEFIRAIHVSVPDKLMAEDRARL